MKKIFLVLVMMCGCTTSLKTTVYHPVNETKFALKIIADQKGTAGIFESIFKAELQKSGYSMADDSPAVIEIVIASGQGGDFASKTIITSVTTTISKTDKILLQSVYSQDANSVDWGSQNAAQIATRTAKDFIKKIKLS